MFYTAYIFSLSACVECYLFCFVLFSCLKTEKYRLTLYSHHMAASVRIILVVHRTLGTKPRSLQK